MDLGFFEFIFIDVKHYFFSKKKLFYGTILRSDNFLSKYFPVQKMNKFNSRMKDNGVVAVCTPTEYLNMG